MATLTLKNVPDRLYEELKAAAARSRRSLNQESIARLEASLAQAAEDEDALWREIIEFGDSLSESARAATTEQIDSWKREGRM